MAFGANRRIGDTPWVETCLDEVGGYRVGKAHMASPGHSCIAELVPEYSLHFVANFEAFRPDMRADVGIALAGGDSVMTRQLASGLRSDVSRRATPTRVHDREGTARGNDNQGQAIREVQERDDPWLVDQDPIDGGRRLDAVCPEEIGPVNLLGYDKGRGGRAQCFEHDLAVALHGLAVVIDVTRAVQARIGACADATRTAGERDPDAQAREQRLVGERNKTMRPQGERIENGKRNTCLTGHA